MDRGRSIILYADHILLMSQLVDQLVDLEQLLHLCKRELNWLDMAINFKKSCCLRTGPCFAATFANITSVTGHVLPWTNKIRYLGIFLIESSVFTVNVL